MNFWQHQEDARRRTRGLLLAFALAVLALAAAVHGALVLAWLGVGWMLHLRLPFPLGFAQVNVGVTLLLVLGGWLLEISNLRAGGVRLAQRIGAREARPAVSHAEQRLCNIIDELAIAAHMPRPQAMVLPRADVINAFAAGWEPADAVVAVTQGALDYLTREELQGMVAHELGHLYEGDTYLKMQLAGMVQGLELVHGFGDHLRGYGVLGAFFGSLVMAVGFAGWLAGRVFKAAVSRQREYLADARAVQWTRSKNGLGGVLRKVLAQWQAAPRPHERVAPMGLAHPVVQHMLLVELPSRHLLARWLDSHPPLEDRVCRIYGRSMPPLPLAPVHEAPDPPRRPPAMPEPGAQTLASKVDPFARL